MMIAQFTTAQLAISKGWYNPECCRLFKNGALILTPAPDAISYFKKHPDPVYTLAPSLRELQDWLYLQHDLVVNTPIINGSKFMAAVCKLRSTGINFGAAPREDLFIALEEGVVIALKMLP